MRTQIDPGWIYYTVYLVLTSQFSPHPRPLSHRVEEGPGVRGARTGAV